LKQGFFNNAEFRKYLLYALGEMILVIVGILIALQIDNWNTEKLQRESLRNYLHTIARNIESDLSSIMDLQSERTRVFELAVRWNNFQSRGPSYSVREVMLGSQVISEASTLRHFNASSSGYEALKSSGVLDQMRGTDIEKLLYDYYDTVARIARSERDHNEFSTLLSLQMLARWPDGIDPWELSSAFVLTAGRFETLQSLYRSVLLDSTTQELMQRPQSVGAMLLEYDTLDRLGRAFQRLVEIDRMDLDRVASGILDGIYDPRSGAAQPDVIVNGKVSWHSHRLIAADANDPRVSYEASAAGLKGPFDPDSFQRIGDSLHINHHGGAAWAGIWFTAGTGQFLRQSPDYSMYSKLVLELKGDAGGEKIIVNMEDRDDPADGTSTRYAIELTDRWQTYEIDLAEFKTADLSILSVPLGFVFFEEPVAFSVRTAKFTRGDHATP
jgi:hypothetical protein